MPLQMLGLGLFSMWQPVVVARNATGGVSDVSALKLTEDLRGDSWRVRRLAW